MFSLFFTYLFCSHSFCINSTCSIWVCWSYNSSSHENLHRNSNRIKIDYRIIQGASNKFKMAFFIKYLLKNKTNVVILIKIACFIWIFATKLKIMRKHYDNLLVTSLINAHNTRMHARTQSCWIQLIIADLFSLSVKLSFNSFLQSSHSFAFVLTCARNSNIGLKLLCSRNSPLSLLAVCQCSWEKKKECTFFCLRNLSY